MTETLGNSSYKS